MARIKANESLRYAELLTSQVDAYVRQANYENIASALANRILIDLVKQAQYNDYSGNLARSYFAYFSLGGEEYLYICENNVSKEPVIKQGKTYYTRHISEYKTQFRKSGKELDHRNVEFYKIRKKRHSRTRKGRAVSLWRENRRRPIEHSTSEIHRYTDEIPKPLRKMLTSGYWGIAVGNYTPYRRFVEARGFRVIGGYSKKQWENLAKTLIRQHISISLKQLAYRFTKGQKLDLQQYDQKIQPGRYASPKLNAQLSYRGKIYTPKL